MKKNFISVAAPYRRTILLTASLAALAFGATRGSSAGMAARRQGGPPPPPQLGRALPQLSSADLLKFNVGLDSFQTIEDREDGLGPVFNGIACSECHQAGAIGGAGTNIRTARVTRIGGIVAGRYSDLVEFGGPVLQARSLHESDPSYPILPEVVPPQARFVSRRITTPLFGLGLIEAIPDAVILSRTKGTQPDGIRGMANMVLNPETGQTEVGRFGWKCQHSSIHVFSADAYLNEMGITNTIFPHENLPQGQPIPPELDDKADPEDLEGDTEHFSDYMRFLAPAMPTVNPREVEPGRRLFEAIKCGACHVPEMVTGNQSNPALRFKPVRLYSDLLVHRMGAALADGVQQGLAKGDQWRTAPLWGLSRRPFLMHDGRATTLAEAIRLHGGEGAISRDRYFKLKPLDRLALDRFLNTL